MKQKRNPSKPPIPHNCVQCGNTFMARERMKQRFCSPECRYKSLKRLEQRNCIVCGGEFHVRPSSKNKTCSVKCKNTLVAQANTDLSKHIRTTCPACQKEFTYLASWPRKYCCKKCAAIETVTNIKRFSPSIFTATCENCGQEFETTPKRSRGRFCSQKCFGEWSSRNTVGEKHPNKGKSFPRPKNLPPPLFKSCEVCGKEFLTKQSHANRRRCCSRSCSAKLWSKERTGENSPTWLGGHDPYYGPSWQVAKRDARERDRKCMRCGVTPEVLGRELDVHHVVPFRKFGRDRHLEANDLSNLMCLCFACHLKVEWETNRRK